MTTDFNLYLQKFFTEYLPKDESYSRLTVASYSKTFALFLSYLRDSEHILIEEMTAAKLTRELVAKFLRYLSEQRHNCAATRNQRKAAIVSFVKYLRYYVPEYQQQYDAIIALKIKTPVNRSPVFLSTEGLEAYLSVVLEDEQRFKLRNLLLISLMAGSGLRVSEAISLRPKDLQLGTPASLTVTGKGGINRAVPIQPHMKETMLAYLRQTGLDHPARREEYLFKNQYGGPLSRHGAYHIVTTYADKARERYPDLIPQEITPHTLRHTFATLNIARGVDIIYVRDLLGHKSVQTTEQFYIGQYRKVRGTNAISESLEKIIKSENNPKTSRIKNIEENTLIFLENLTKCRGN